MVRTKRAGSCILVVMLLGCRAGPGSPQTGDSRSPVAGSPVTGTISAVAEPAEAAGGTGAFGEPALPVPSAGSATTSRVEGGGRPSAQDEDEALDRAAAAAAAWAGEVALPFDSTDPRADRADLEILRDLIGEARIVGLGEATHGTREFARTKHRIIDYLVREMDFTVLALEANLPEAEALGGFVDGDGSELSQVLGEFGPWYYTTEELRELSMALRRLEGQGIADLRVTGFDMQLPARPRAIVRDFVERHDPAFLPSLDKAFLEAGDPRREPEAMGIVYASLPGELVAGETVELSGQVKTLYLEAGWAGLWIAAGDADRLSIAYANTEDRAQAGSSPWTAQALRLEIPEETAVLNFGAVMTGRGTAWFDDFELTVAESPIDLGEDLDADFESADLGRWASIGDPRYRAAITASSAAEGRQSMVLRSAPNEAGLGADRPRQPSERALELAAAVHQRVAAVAGEAGGTIPEPERDLAIRSARMLVQELELQAGATSAAATTADTTDLRDRYLAENIAWIADRDPQARIVVWAHNLHVGRAADSMGAHLAERYGADYLPIGLTAGRGRCGLVVTRTVEAQDMEPPPPGSVEQVLAAAGPTRFILDLRGIRPPSPGTWFAQSHPFRTVGWKAPCRRTVPTRASEAFDLLVYIDRTSAIRFRPEAIVTGE